MTDLPPRREPVFKVPFVIVGFIALCALIQVGRSLLGSGDELAVIAPFAFVPARLTAWIDPTAVFAKVDGWLRSGNVDQVQDATALRFFLVQSTPPAITLVSYALLHGNWTHLALNSVWLLAFGTPVARRFGPIRFLALLGVCAGAGALAQWACFPFGVEPVIGASAAVSGCMGAALRFMFDPRPVDGLPDPHASVAPVWAMARNRRALSFLLVWFATNIISGIGSVSFGLTEAPIAWQAHIGGFLAGLLLFWLFDPSLRVPSDAGQRVGDEPAVPPALD